MITSTKVVNDQRQVYVSRMMMVMNEALVMCVWHENSYRANMNKAFGGAMHQ